MAPTDPNPDPTPPEQTDPEPTEESSTPTIWYWLSFLISPIAAVVYFAGRDDGAEARELRKKEERIRRLHPDLKEVREAAVNEMQCPGCTATVNPVTMDGLHSRKGEPWTLICDRCNTQIVPDT
jgi:hypothetical protein